VVWYLCSQRAPEKLGQLRFRRCYTAKAIDDALATCCNPERHPELRKLALKNLRTARAKIAGAKKRTGVTQADERNTEACHAAAEATRALFRTAPTTILGALSLLRYVAECEESGDDILQIYMKDDPTCVDGVTHGYQSSSPWILVAPHSAFHGIDAAEKGPVLLLPIGGIDLLLAVSDWLNPPKKH
jgi:hypothetical protein